MRHLARPFCSTAALQIAREYVQRRPHRPTMPMGPDVSAPKHRGGLSPPSENDHAMTTTLASYFSILYKNIQFLDTIYERA
jgi:hypothetical protein